MAHEIIPMTSSGLEQTLVRVLSLVNDEMMKLSSDIQAIEFSTHGVISMLQDAVEKQKRGHEAVRGWLIKLEKVAEHVLDDLSYEIGRQKVHNNSLGQIHFLGTTVFTFKLALAQKVEKVNRELRMIEHEGKDHLRTSESSSSAFRFRLCLGFCLSFPTDFLIQTTELIQLCMAAGLIQSVDEGNYCFQTNVSPTLQAVEKDEIGNVVVYRIGGLIHESSSNSNNSSSVRYLYASTPAAIPKHKAEKLHSLILDGVPFQESRNLERLGILVFLNSVDMEMLPSSIGRLKHLRYLDVSNTRIRALPGFITELYNLQTLRFLRCKELNLLPTQFDNLINLKNIAFSFEHQVPFGLGHLTCLETISFFAVGSNRGGGIQELRSLNGLRGHLEITRLEEVRDKKESEAANMQQKVLIRELSFQWSSGSHDRSCRDKEVLDGLKPHQNIQKLKIKYYMGEHWPSWMLKTRCPSNDDPFVLQNLVSISLEQCWNCIHFLCLGDLPRLKFLTMKHMRRVMHIHNELWTEIGTEFGYYPQRVFPALESLSLSWMENLTEWSSSKMSLFSRLKTLSIHSCAKLTCFPIQNLSTLDKIEIKDCEELRFLFDEHPSFRSSFILFIEGCPKLTYLPSWLLSNKRFDRLRVRRCEWLKFISNDLGLHSFLSSLEINCCKSLTFFPEEILCKFTRMTKLSIGAFSEKLHDFRYLNQIKDVPRLKELEIWGSDVFGRKMSRLPYQLLLLTKLESLKITGFTAMEALPEWLSDLQSLRYFSLNHCWHLEFRSTATIMQRLSNLNQVYINGCHTLEQKSKSEWNKFSQISKIRIHFSQEAE